MTTPPVLEAVRTKFELLRPLMTERLRRQWAACEAHLLGRGGVAAVAEATGLSRTTLWAGLKELRQRPGTCLPASGPTRRVGGLEKAGIDRGFQERGPGVATRGYSRGGSHQGLPGQAVGQGHAVGGLRRHAE